MKVVLYEISSFFLNKQQYNTNAVFVLYPLVRGQYRKIMEDYRRKNAVFYVSPPWTFLYFNPKLNY